MTVWQWIGASALVLAVSTPSLAQTPASSFEQLMAADVMQPGQSVYVTNAWGRRIKGRLGEVRSGSLVLMQGSRRIEMTEADVLRIQRRDSIQDGLWLGVAAGVAAAWIAPHLVCDLPDDECAAIVFGAIGLPSIAGGAITGALVDAAITKTVFRFAGTRGIAALQVSPLLGSRRAGALATIQF